MGKRKSYRLDNSSSEKYRKAIITLYKSFGQATVLVVMTRKGIVPPIPLQCSFLVVTMRTASVKTV